MRFRTIRACSALLLSVLFSGVSARPATAQSKEQRQLMADVRMLQEQNQTIQNLLGTIQNLLGSIADSIKAVNARIDEQANVTSKAMADQKLVIDNLTNNVREIREKLDDTNVRLGTLNTEVDALREGLQQLNARPTTVIEVPVPEQATAAGVPGVGEPGAAASPVVPPPAVPIGTSPQTLWAQGYSDYTVAQWDLAIAGFEALIKYFPRSERASDAQLYIGHSHLAAGRNDKAVEAYEAAIRNYPGSPVLPEAYYKKGIALKSLKQSDAARAAFEFVVKMYPDSAPAGLARQQITQPARPN